MTFDCNWYEVSAEWSQYKLDKLPSIEDRGQTDCIITHANSNPNANPLPWLSIMAS